MVNIGGKNLAINIIFLLIVLSIFSFIVFYIFEQFKPKCKDKNHMYDKKRKICRDVCDLDNDPSCTSCTHWDDNKKKCEKCPNGTTWDGKICK
jgi:hypothetical protein